MNDDELNALNDLSQGKLEGLGKLLDKGVSQLHPAILLKLRVMINGSAEECDYQLVAKRHPDLKRGQSLAEKTQVEMKELETALSMLRHGALTEGHSDAAKVATATELGIAVSTVENHWRNQKEFIFDQIRWGMIEEEFLPGPIADRHGIRHGEWANLLKP